MAPRILINAIHAKTGGGRTYLRQMLPLLADDPRLELHLIATRSQCESLRMIEPRIRFHPAHPRGGFLGMLLWEQLVLPLRARRLRANVTFSPANFGPLLAPRPVILLRNALAVAAHERRWSKRLYWSALRMMTVLARRTCCKAIAVSGYAQRSLAPAGGFKVQVIPHGVDDSFRNVVRAPAACAFVLAVGDIYVQKNLRTLIAAFARVRDVRPRIRLKIAGRPVDEDYFRMVRDDAARFRISDAVDFLGEVPRERLLELYGACSVFVFPSTVETFGQPLVEAMAAGAPIACAAVAAMPEIAGEAALYFDPLDADAMASSILALLEDLARATRLGAAARERARAYAWPETARRTSEVLLAAAGAAEAAARSDALAAGRP